MASQLSTSFLLPVLQFPPLVLRSYTKTYIGNVNYEGNNIWGNFLYLQITKELLDDILLSTLRNHEQYKTELDEEDFVLFVFEFTPMQRLSIVMPFIMGKYSEIDRNYVNKNFPKEISGSVSFNWRILHKDEWDKPAKYMSLREYWFRRIGSPIPEEGEVWPKPKMEDEIYDFYNEVLKEELAEGTTCNN